MVMREAMTMHKDDPRKERTYWCVECKKAHAPTQEHPLCAFLHCLHAPMPPDLYFDFKGWRFAAPFYCMACGAELCHRQWAFARVCGGCDLGRTGKALPNRHIFAGPHVLVDPNAEHCFAVDAFIDPATRDEYPDWPQPRPISLPRPRPVPQPRKRLIPGLR